MCQGFDVMLLQLETATHMLFMFYCFSYFVDKVDMVGTIAGDDSRSLSMLPIPIADLNQQLSLQLSTGTRFTDTVHAGAMSCDLKRVHLILIQMQ